MWTVLLGLPIAYQYLQLVFLVTVWLQGSREDMPMGTMEEKS
jgi:hypothetical protein